MFDFVNWNAFDHQTRKQFQRPFDRLFVYLMIRVLLLFLERTIDIRNNYFGYELTVGDDMLNQIQILMFVMQLVGMSISSITLHVVQSN